MQLPVEAARWPQEAVGRLREAVGRPREVVDRPREVVDRPRVAAVQVRSRRGVRGRGRGFGIERGRDVGRRPGNNVKGLERVDCFRARRNETGGRKAVLIDGFTVLPLCD